MNANAKEKAGELIERFAEMEDNTNNFDYDKKCALICVDEMLSIERKYSNFGGVVYLQEVKEEIEKL